VAQAPKRVRSSKNSGFPQPPKKWPWNVKLIAGT
jgi:hypothetical protein